MSKRYGLRKFKTETTVRAEQPWWLVFVFTEVGFCFDWYCAFEWFSEKYRFWSTPVILRKGLIVLLCGTVALLVVFVANRRLRDAGAVFFLASGTLLGNLLNRWWGGLR